MTDIEFYEELKTYMKEEGYHTVALLEETDSDSTSDEEDHYLVNGDDYVLTLVNA